MSLINPNYRPLSEKDLVKLFSPGQPNPKPTDLASMEREESLNFVKFNRKNHTKAKV